MSNIAAKNQQMHGKAIKVQEFGIFFLLGGALCVFRTKMWDYAI